MRKIPTIGVIALLPFICRSEFKEGNATRNITPRTLPVLVNSGMMSKSRDKIKTQLGARSIAMTEGRETIVIVVASTGPE